MKKLSLCIVAVFVLSGGALAEQTKEAFYDMCHETSLKDGLDDAAAGKFCDCLADKAVADEALYTELYEAGKNEPSLEARLAALSETANSAAESCQKPN